MTQPIKLIAVDLDGTLLNSKHQITERTEKALKTAIERGVQVVLATGKTRQSARDIIPRLGINTPGIYLQGLTIYQPDGSISYQKTLDAELARQVITFAEDRGFVVVAYSGTHILVRTASVEGRKLTEDYHEPAPEVVGPLQNILDEMPIHKLIAVRLDEPRRINALRWQLGLQLDGRGRLVQALPDMLEILPPGASKGAALKVLLKELGISANEMLAIGDAENDIEMIKLAGIGVAVGNAVQSLKDAADHIVASNDEDGVGEAVERFVLGIDPARAAITSGENGAGSSDEGKSE